MAETRTHTIADTSGVSVCWGLVEPPALLEEAKTALQNMGGKGGDKIQIDTTHFVATSSAGRENPGGGPGVEYQKAQQLSIPVVSPDWLIACAREKRMVPIANYCELCTLGHGFRSGYLQTPCLQTRSAPPTTPPPSRRPSW